MTIVAPIWAVVAVAALVGIPAIGFVGLMGGLLYAFVKTFIRFPKHWRELW